MRLKGLPCCDDMDALGTVLYGDSALRTGFDNA